MQTVTTDDRTRISYRVAGEGHDLLLVHGITESGGTWEPLVQPLLEEGYRVTTLDLRGHGSSGRAVSYDLAAMASDVSAVLGAVGADDALLVGHSLGGAVVSAYAATGPCRGVVNVDQPLALAAFQEALAPLEPLLRGGPDEFTTAMGAVFDQMAGPLDGPERARVEGLRRPDQEVVLGVWDLVLTSDAADLEAMVDRIVGGVTVPYLSLHGIDPGDGYEAWLTARIPTATVELWADHGHYPHLIDPERFVSRVVGADPR